MSTMRKSRRRFTDAQGRLLPIVGWVTMKLWLGECPLEFKVYVFETMGVPFLLGTNALQENGLVIDAHEETLYIGWRDALLHCPELQTTYTDWVKPNGRG